MDPTTFKIFHPAGNFTQRGFNKNKNCMEWNGMEWMEWNGMEELKLIVATFNGNSIGWKNFKFFPFHPLHASGL